MRLWLFLAALCGVAVSPAAGSVDWAAARFALAQVETGNDPEAVGASGERGAYQILPSVARQYGGGYDWATAQAILSDRLARLPRHPTPEDLYLLWHRPGDFARAGYRPERLPDRVRSRAERFGNLYRDFQSRQK